MSIVSASILEVCFSANSTCGALAAGTCKRIHLEFQYFLQFQQACTIETAEAIARMNELNIYDAKQRVQLKLYACETGLSRDECSKRKNRRTTVCNNLHHRLAYAVRDGVNSGEIKMQDSRDDTFNVLCSGSSKPSAMKKELAGTNDMQIGVHTSVH